MADAPMTFVPAGPAAATPHRIVVVGGGAGGLELATRLGDTLGRRGRAHVTLIEKSRSHFWKPHLHEIAAGSIDLHVHATDYLAQSHGSAKWSASTARAGACSSRRCSTTTARRSRSRTSASTTRW
jgi:NADH dehydrogenase